MRAYAAAIVALAAAVLLRWVLDPLMGDTLPLVTLFGAVAAAVWVGGYPPATIVAIGGYVACSYLFIEPRGRLGLDVLSNVVGLVAYLFTCSLIIAFGEAARIAQTRASRQRELLRVTLASIGDAVITTDINGRVTHLNAVAESLTGWSHEEPSASRSTRSSGSSTRTRAGRSKARRQGAPGGSGRRPGESHGADSKGRRRAARLTTAPRQSRTNADSVSGCVLIFRDVSAQRRQEQDKAESAADRAAARLDRRVLGRRDHQQVARRRHSKLERGRRAALRLHRRTGRRPAHLPGHPRRAHRRGGRHHRQPEGRAADRAFRDRARALRRPAHSGFAHHLAHQGRRGPGRRRVKDRAGHHRPQADRPRTTCRQPGRRALRSRPAQERVPGDAGARAAEPAGAAQQRRPGAAPGGRRRATLCMRRPRCWSVRSARWPAWWTTCST